MQQFQAFVAQAKVAMNAPSVTQPVCNSTSSNSSSSMLDDYADAINDFKSKELTNLFNKLNSNYQQLFKSTVVVENRISSITKLRPNLVKLDSISSVVDRLTSADGAFKQDLISRIGVVYDSANDTLIEILLADLHHENNRIKDKMTLNFTDIAILTKVKKAYNPLAQPGKELSLPAVREAICGTCSTWLSHKLHSARVNFEMSERTTTQHVLTSTATATATTTSDAPAVVDLTKSGAGTPGVTFGDGRCINNILQAPTCLLTLSCTSSFNPSIMHLTRDREQLPHGRKQQQQQQLSQQQPLPVPEQCEPPQFVSGPAGSSGEWIFRAGIWEWEPQPQQQQQQKQQQQISLSPSQQQQQPQQLQQKINGRKRKPADALTLLHRRQLKSRQLPALFHGITNKGIFNLSDKTLNVAEEAILSLGLKFVIRPQPSTDNELLVSFEQFCRTVRLKKQFVHSDDTFNSTLYVPNKGFVPKTAGLVLENYLSVANDKLLLALQTTTVQHCTRKVPKMFTIAIKALVKDTSIVIQTADKNLGVVLVNRDWYEKECMRHLMDITNYVMTSMVPTAAEFTTMLESILVKYNKLTCKASNTNEIIYTKLANYLLQFNKVKQLKHAGSILCGKFYITIKVHKEILSGRPIVSTLRSATLYASRYLDTQLQPVMKTVKSYLRNSTDLVLNLEQCRNLPKDFTLLTADIENMYPSIDIVDGIFMLKRALLKYNSKVRDKCKQVDTDFICDLAQWVLSNNYFIFGELTYWRQIKGIAMGTPFAVSFASIYIGEIENDILSKATFSTYRRCILYYRFIDDIFAIFNNEDTALKFMDAFNTATGGKLKLKLEHIGDSVVFMDLTVSKGDRFKSTNILDISLFQKSQNAYLYLPQSSYHTDSVFKFTIKSELWRYRIRCSDDASYRKYAALLYDRLSVRGYSKEYLQNTMNITLDRDEIINNLIWKRLHPATNSTCIPLIFKTTNTPRQAALQIKQFLATAENIWADPDSRLIFTQRHGVDSVPIICYKRTSNLRDMLTSSKYEFKLNVPITRTQD
jgi:hypothetical protein